MNIRFGYLVASLLGVFAMALYAASLLASDATRSLIWFAAGVIVMLLGVVVAVVTILLNEVANRIISAIQVSQLARDSDTTPHVDDSTAS
jgi:hypothetical protein